MRKLIFIILAGISLSGFAQRSPVDKFLKKYDFEQGITINEMKPGSPEFAEELKVKGEAIDKLLEKVEKLTIVKGDSASNPLARKTFFDEASAVLKNDMYTNIVHVNSDGEKICIYLSHHKSGNIREVVFLLLEEDNMLMMNVTADLDMSQLGLNEILECLTKQEHKEECEKDEDHGHEHGQDRGD